MKKLIFAVVAMLVAVSCCNSGESVELRITYKDGTTATEVRPLKKVWGEEYIRFVDRPTMAYNVEEIVEKLAKFGKNAVIQTMFMKGEVDGRSVDNTGDEYVLPWLETVKKIAPREVMIYTIDRETPQEGLKKASHEELDRIVALLAEAGIRASA